MDLLPLEVYIMIGTIDTRCWCALLAVPAFASWTMTSHARVLRRRFLLKTVTRDGNRVIKKWTLNGMLHNFDDKPAEKNGNECSWYQRGLLHRDNGPAEISYFRYFYWYQRGLLHRDNDMPAKVFPRSAAWYQHGLLHREGNLPARTSPGICEFYENGIEKNYIISRTMVEFICKAENIYGSKYYYLISDLEPRLELRQPDDTIVPILCRNHGIFYTTIGSHLRGDTSDSTCGRCNYDSDLARCVAFFKNNDIKFKKRYRIMTEKKVRVRFYNFWLPDCMTFVDLYKPDYFLRGKFSRKATLDQKLLENKEKEKNAEKWLHSFFCIRRDTGIEESLTKLVLPRATYFKEYDASHKNGK